jgi:hypothetical protein
MPWSQTWYPPAMRRLPPDVRLKAIEIANATLAEGYDEGQAIRMAIAAAKRWAWGPAGHDHPERCGASARKNLPSVGRSDVQATRLEGARGGARHRTG